MARVFSAIDIEDEEVLEELAEVRDRLNLGFNPVKKEKIHVTLEFFEDIDEEEIEEVKKGLENIDTEPFTAKISELGAFPSEDYIRVVWAGMEHPKIYEVQEKASKHPVESSGEHEFKPHVTLLRVENLSSKEKGKLQKTFEEYRDTEIGEIRIDKVKLFESKLTENGVKYRELESIKL